jgi:integrase/recombinase XerC
MEVPLLETVMIKIPSLQSSKSLRAWLLEGPLSTHIPTYVAKLRRGRYAPHASERNLNALAADVPPVGCRL